jgi:VanZ family protein
MDIDRIAPAGVDLVLWAATVLCGAVTLWLSLFTVPPGASAFSEADKLEHATAYLVTALLLLLAAVWRPGRGDGPFARWEGWVVVAVMSAGGAIEVIQSRIGREGEWTDWLAEIVAVALAWGGVVWLRARSSRRAGRPGDQPAERWVRGPASWGCASRRGRVRLTPGVVN